MSSICEQYAYEYDILFNGIIVSYYFSKAVVMYSKSIRAEVRGTTYFNGGAYCPSKTSPSYALTTLIIFRYGRTGRDR